MSKFEQSHPHHEVHEIHRPQGHGMMDQKYAKGNRSPIAGSVPTIDTGSMPSSTEAGSPGSPAAMYGAGSAAL